MTGKLADHHRLSSLPLDQAFRLDNDRAGQNDKFHHVDPALAASNPGNERLMALQPQREVSLRQPCLNGEILDSLADARRKLTLSSVST